MIEFKIKPFAPNSVVDDWAEITEMRFRTCNNFEFSYCDYRIGDKVYTEMCPEFLEAFKKEKFWLKLKV